MTHYLRTVAYHETDKMGIAHHSNYVKWMEEARVRYLEDIGAPFQAIEALGIVSPVAAVSVEYKVPCTFGDELDIRPRITRYSGVKLEVEYVMRNRSTGDLVATATSRHGFLKDGRVCSLKKAAPEIHAAMDMAMRLDAGTMDVHSKDGVVWLTPHVFDQFPWIVAGTSTRLGGVSEGFAGSMNFCLNEFDSAGNIAENRRIFCNAVGLDDARFTNSRQVHRDDIAIVRADDMALAPEGRTEKFGDIDGMVTDVPGAVLACYSADCAIVSLVDPAHRAIGLVHAGWRGTVAKIAAKALALMAEQYGTDPSDVFAAISPSICKECFEVGQDVVDATDAPFGDDSFDLAAIYSPGSSEGKYHYDIWEANVQVLANAGVDRGRVEVAGVCTCCNPELLFSHRASAGKRGTIMTYLGIA